MKNYIAAHADLVPSEERLAGADLSDRGGVLLHIARREYQMDWGFVDVETGPGACSESRARDGVPHCGVLRGVLPNARGRACSSA